jgi:hypothetical protein
MNNGVLYRMRETVIDELRVNGLPVQKEQPLHEGTFYYAHIMRDDSREAWDARAEEALRG